MTTIYISRLDYETLERRGRCTLTAYSEPVGDASTEVALVLDGTPPVSVCPECVRPHPGAVLDGLMDFRHTPDGMVRGGKYVNKDDLLAALAEPVQAEPSTVPREWRFALRKLAFMARTSGGTAGPDAGLMAALAETESLLAKPYLLAAAPQAEPSPTRADLIAGLKFYAEKGHFDLADESAWDTVSGEPPNFWCDEAGTATVEDGEIARRVLAGEVTAEHLAEDEPTC